MDSLSFLMFCASMLLLAATLQGCGGHHDSTTTTSTPSTTTTTTRTHSNYDGDAPSFMLEDVGLKGMAYSVLYLPDQKCLNEMPADSACQTIVNDDVYSDWGENFWGASGRNDILTMKTLGVNGVRMYGNDPRLSKEKFFDALYKHEMKAIAGLSDYPYSQAPQACFNNGVDCSADIETYYASVLSNGTYAKHGFYHKAIDIISLINEPQWNIPGLKVDYVKAMVTAFDGLLSAEKKLGIKPWSNGKLPKISVTWSDTFYCPHPPPDRPDCPQFSGVGEMASMYEAIHDPSLIGYTPKNDIKKAYAERWINAMNAFIRAEQLKQQNLDPVSTWPSLKDFKLYLGEWAPAAPKGPTWAPGYTKEDLKQDLHALYSTYASSNPNLVGVSFFEFQRAYNRADVKDSSFGLFKLTASHPWNTTYVIDDKAKNRPINCLAWKDDNAKDFAQVIADQFGGKLPTLTCPSLDAATGIGIGEINI